jgi:hypothetical protein
VGALEDLMGNELKHRLRGGEAIALPLAYANRGTFTLPVFARKGTEPIAIFRMDAARSLVRHEAEVLRYIEERAGLEIRRSVPRVIWCGTFGSRQAALHSYMPGEPIRGARRTRVLTRHLRALREWLDSLYRIRLEPSRISHPRLARERRLYEDKTSLSTSIGNPDLEGRIWGAIQRLKRAGLRPVLTHGDFHPGNVLVVSRRLTVLDWEYAAVSWPVYDWFHYICSSLIDGNRKAARDPGVAMGLLLAALRPQSPLASRVRKQTQHLIDGLGTSPDLYPDFVILGICDFVRRRYGPKMIPAFSPLLSTLVES